MAQGDFSKRISVAVKKLIGSWHYVIGYVAGSFTWMFVSHLLGKHSFDPFPYILLNLAYSMLAGIIGPIILIGQNDQEEQQAIQQQIQAETLIRIEATNDAVQKLVANGLHISESIREMLKEHKEQLDYMIESDERILEAIDDLDDEITPSDP